MRVSVRDGDEKNITLTLTLTLIEFLTWLFFLVEHDDHFSFIRNENGEYVLDPSIPCSCLTAIHLFITSKQSSSLFSRLPPGRSVLGMLELYDFLCIDPIANPILKHIGLVRSDQTENAQKNKDVKYRRSNLMETRNTATEFVIALAKNIYSLDDLETRERAFLLLEIILSSPAVFNRPCRIHTLTIVSKCCLSLFIIHQRNHLNMAQQSVKDEKPNFNSLILDENQPLPDQCENAFTWTIIQQPIEVNGSDGELQSLPLVNSRSDVTWEILWMDLGELRTRRNFSAV